MRMPCAKLLVSLALGLAVPVAMPSVSAAGEPATGPDAELQTRIEKQIKEIEDRMMSLQEQELELSMKIMQAQQKANEAIENPGKAAEKLAKGEMAGGLRQYKAILISCARQLQAFNQRLTPVLKSVKALGRDRAKVPDPLKARIDTLTARVESKHRTNLDKVAHTYKQCAEFRTALGIYLSLYKNMPAAERVKDNVLTENIGELYDKAGDPRKALLFYKSIFDAKPAKTRYTDRTLGMKVAALYVKCGDKRSAVGLYRALYEALPKDKRSAKEGQDLMKKIEEIEGKSRQPGGRDDKKRY